ncbi:MAG: hypothetical protein K6U04_14115 [Armatimonadetes bacterium]|nr:hypothetical protein [Armatimonadota bacterium]
MNKLKKAILSGTGIGDWESGIRDWGLPESGVGNQTMFLLLKASKENEKTDFGAGLETPFHFL